MPVIHVICIFLAQTYTRLNKVGICLSHQQTRRVIDRLAEKHDHLLKTWKALCESNALAQVPALEAMTPMSTVDTASQSSQSNGNGSLSSKGVAMFHENCYMIYSFTNICTAAACMVLCLSVLPIVNSYSCIISMYIVWKLYIITLCCIYFIVISFSYRCYY